MSPRHRVALALVALLSLVALARAPGARGADAPGKVRLVVLHTNDVHGGILPRGAALAQLDAKEDVGGHAALASFVRAERAAAAAAGAHVLLLDGGDVWRGTPEGDLTRGDLVVEAFGRLGYDAVALGNHELDLGVDNAARLARAARYPWLAANVRETATGETPAWLRRHVVKEVGGLRVGLVGLTTVDTPRIVVGGDRLGLTFLHEAAVAEEEARALASSTDLVLFVTHTGPRTDAEVLAKVLRCPLVVGGHTHQRLIEPLDPRGDRSGWIVQAGTGGVLVGRVVLDVDATSKQVTLVESRLVPLVPSAVGTDPEEAAFLAQRLEAIDALRALREVAGTLTAALPRVGRDPWDTSPAGHWFSDAAREAARADAALSNRGGIRVTLPAGPVTLRDLHLVMPFENTLVVVPLRGAELKAILAASLTAEGRSPLEVSGISARYRLVTTDGKPKVEWRRFDVAGAPVDDAKVYRVATNSFLAGGGDGYALLSRPGTEDLGVLVRDVLRDHLRRHAPYTPDTATRLVREE